MDDERDPARRHVLIVEHDPVRGDELQTRLGDGYDVDRCDDTQAAIPKLHALPYDAILLAALPSAQASGSPLANALNAIRHAAPDVAIVVYGDSPTVAMTVAAMRAGAFDVVRRLAISAELRASVDRAAAHGALAREVHRLRGEVDRARGLGAMVGESPPMRQLLSMVERVAESDATVLIVGESGTGKELLARTLHRVGPRARGPFVAFDCSALTPSLLEAELFGHEKGSFTGAGKARRGLFREAHGGTIFLDEIGDIAASVQNKLLRVLQEREVKPVGGDRFVPIDVRVVAATNQDLRQLVQRGVFREDLYWRLAVVPVQVPPLRERKQDIPLLAAHIIERRRGAAKTSLHGGGKYPRQLTQAALARLVEYHWPGNIRELENVLSRAAILCDGEKIRADDLDLVGLPEPGSSRRSSRGGIVRPLKVQLDEAVRDIEHAAIENALAASGGSVSAAARSLGISRASMYNKLNMYGLAKDVVRGG